MSDKSEEAPVRSWPLLHELQDDFPSPTYEQWRKVTEKSLKGASFDKLLTSTYEGIQLQPMYREEDIEKVHKPDDNVQETSDLDVNKTDHHHVYKTGDLNVPGYAPYKRGTNLLPNRKRPWLVSQPVDLSDPNQAGRMIKDESLRGQDTVHIALDEATQHGFDAEEWMSFSAGSPSRQPADSDTHTGTDADLHTVSDTVTNAPPVSGKRGVTLNSVRHVRALLGADEADNSPGARVDCSGIAHLPLFIRAGSVALPILATWVAGVENVHRKRSEGDVIQHKNKRQQPMEGKNHSPVRFTRQLNGCIGADPLGTQATYGSLPYDYETSLQLMSATVHWLRDQDLALRPVLVSADVYHDSGASAVQELGFALATGVSYMRSMIKDGLSPDQAATAIQFSFSIGSHLFMEISKLRAARKLWSDIVHAFGGGETGQKMVIHARTSHWNKTAYDPYVNMLRGAGEAFAAAVSGADSLEVTPFDRFSTRKAAFSRRVARNTQLILQEEAHLAQPLDPAGGSWYVEWLTEQVGRESWSLFQEVEKKGGMYAALQDGFVQQTISVTAAAKRENLNRSQDVFVGVNRYANAEEQLWRECQGDPQTAGSGINIRDQKSDEVQFGKRRELLQSLAEQADRYCSAAPVQEATKEVEDVAEKLTKEVAEKAADAVTKEAADKDRSAGLTKVVDLAIQAAASGATVGEIARACGRRTRFRLADIKREEGVSTRPVHRVRAVQHIEELRLRVERLAAEGKRPRVFLANLGRIPQHKARSDFARDFFGTGGFEVLNNDGFDREEDVICAWQQTTVPVVVICGSDNAYEQLAVTVAKRIKQEQQSATVILAGSPDESTCNTLSRAGVDHFIHRTSDRYALLLALVEQLGGVRT